MDAGTGSFIRRSAAGLVALAVGFILWRGYVAASASHWIRQGKRAAAAGDYGGGIRLLRRAFDRDARQTESARLLAHDALVRGAPAEARRLLESLAPCTLWAPEAVDLFARAAEECGDRDAAEEAYGALARRRPDLAAGRVGLARVRAVAAQDSAGDAQGTASTWRGVALLHLEDDLGCRGYGTASCVEALATARAAGANAVSLNVSGFQPSVGDPTIAFGASHDPRHGDAPLRRTIRDARVVGLRVLLKPYLILERITEEDWRGTIAYESAADMERWWAAYRAFILHYARLAAEEKADSYSVGVELRAMAVAAPERWSRLIADVRAVFPGELTYAANWWGEYDEVPFWPELDWIGVQCFFPLSVEPDPSRGELLAGAAVIASTLEEIALGFGKPLVLTEVGFKSSSGAAGAPWQWPSSDDRADAGIQARAYEAILIAFEGRPWFRGMFFWNWLSDPDPARKFRADFTPQGKPAQRVLERHWGSRGR